METKFKPLEQPLNANERYLHAIAIRMDALVNMMSSFLEVYAKQNGLATTVNEVKEEEVVKPIKKTKK